MRKFNRHSSKTTAALFAAIMAAAFTTACGQNTGTSEGASSTAMEQVSSSAASEEVPQESEAAQQSDSTTENGTAKNNTDESNAGASEEASASLRDAVTAANGTSYNADAFANLLNAGLMDFDLPLHVQTTSFEKQTDSSSVTLVTAIYQTIHLLDSLSSEEQTAYAALKDALEAEDTATVSRLFAEAASAEEAAKETAKNEDMQQFLPYTIESKLKVKRADKQVLSYLRQEYSWFGGAHPNTYYVSHNYHPTTGQELTLRDVCADYNAVCERVLKTLKTYEQNAGDMGSPFFEGYEETVKALFDAAAAAGTPAESDAASIPSVPSAEVSGETLSAASDAAQPELQWFLTDDAFVAVFNAYDIAPYAAGPSTVVIPFDGNESLFTEIESEMK